MKVPYTHHGSRFERAAFCDGCGEYIFLLPGVEAGHELLDCVKYLRTLIEVRTEDVAE